MKKYIGLIIGLLPLITSAQLVMTNNYYVVLKGGSLSRPTTLVLTNPAPSGITRTGNGWIVSENEFNMVRWNIGTATGTYVVPFGYSNALYLPLTLNISNAGTGNGNIKFSTYHSAVLNTPKPSDVNNLIPFILPGSPSNADNSYNIVDRYYTIDANSGYTVKPTAGNITLSYISGTGNSEVASPNTLNGGRLMAQRFNSSAGTWSDWFGEGCTDAVVSNVGTVQTGPVNPANWYRTWSLWDQSMSLPVKITAVNVNCKGSNGSATANVYGGVSPYTYNWAPSGGTSATATGLTLGTYSVTVSDKNGCNSVVAVMIIKGMTLTRDSASDNGSCNGIATVTPNGGTPPYTYMWSPGGQTTDTIKGNCAGTYCCTIIDANGCRDSTCVTVNLVSGVQNVNDPTSKVTIYPNPSSGYFVISGVKQGQLVELYSYLGQELNSTLADNATMHLNLSNEPNGIYLVRIRNKDGSLVIQKKIIKVQ